MVENGVLDEARRVYDHREAYRTAAQAIGYKEFFLILRARPILADCTEALKQATRNYAKRQLTWFRRQNEAVWLISMRRMSPNAPVRWCVHFCNSNGKEGVQ